MNITILFIRKLCKSVFKDDNEVFDLFIDVNIKFSYGHVLCDMPHAWLSRAKSIKLCIIIFIFYFLVIYLDLIMDVIKYGQTPYNTLTNNMFVLNK